MKKENPTNAIKEAYKRLWNGNNPLGFNIRNFFAHPTQIPIIIGVICFLVGLLLLNLTEVFFERHFNESTRWLNILVLLLPLIFVGFSGLLMIIRKETIDKSGNVRTGLGAIVSGIIAILFGWGLSIFMLLVNIFNW